MVSKSPTETYHEPAEQYDFHMLDLSVLSNHFIDYSVDNY